jgi:hypothetical protein
LLALAPPAQDGAELEYAWIEDDAGLRAIDAAAVRDGYRRRFRAMRATLDAGGGVVAGLREGAPICWQLFEPHRQSSYLWLHLEAEATAIFSFGGYVTKAWRGGRLLPELSRRAAERFGNAGYRRICSATAMGNRASIRSHLYRGAGRVGWIAGLRSAGGRACVASDRGLHCGRYDARHPLVYRIPPPPA